jgi:hypothetical protein
MARADAQVRAVLQTVMAQQRSTSAAVDYVTALAADVKANCWLLAETAGHEGQSRMQAVLGSYRWDWKQLRDQLPALARAWIPDAQRTAIGPGIAIDETAQLKKGDATACVAPQHAGCTGTVENCVTTVFSAYVTAHGRPGWTSRCTCRSAGPGISRRRAAGVPDDLTFAAKPQLAMNQLDRLTAGPPGRAAGLMGRRSTRSTASEALRKKAAGPGWRMWRSSCDYQLTLPPARRSAPIRPSTTRCSAPPLRQRIKGPRYSDWAMTATAVEGQYLLIRRLVSRPDSYTFYLCWAPPRPPGDHDLLHHHRRASLAGGGDVQDREGRVRLGPDPGPYLARTCRHTAWPPSPAARRSPSATHSPAASPCPPSTTLPASTRRTPARRPAVATAMTRSARSTCRSHSATLPSRPAAASPAHPRSTRSSCPSPKPPGWPTSPCATPAG